MPGPRNSHKPKKQKIAKAKARRNVLVEVERDVLSKSLLADEPEHATESQSYESSASKQECAVSMSDPSRNLDGGGMRSGSSVIPLDLAPPDNPFITDPGNGPRVKDIEAFLSSFFCPPLSLEDSYCALFAPKEVLTVLEAVLPREVALIVWYNKTRAYERICPACQRLYRLGDSLVDPINGDLVDMNNPETPPHVLREQQLSGICSFPCFFLASYSSHPYTAEVARGAWGLLSDGLDAQTRSLIDATDPGTAAMLRFGFSAWTPSLTDQPNDSLDDQGLGRVMRMTRRKDLGLGEVLQALAWYDEEKDDEHFLCLKSRDDASQDPWYHGDYEQRRTNNEQQSGLLFPKFCTPESVRA